MSDYMDRYTPLIVAKFWSRVDIPNREALCWEWTAAKRRFGYGAMNIAGVQMGAHRIAWELFNGPIPDGLHACHHCDNPSCVNPSHIFLGTHADNMADRKAKGRALGPKKIEEARLVL
jgi:hypothetical protein